MPSYPLPPKAPAGLPDPPKDGWLRRLYDMVYDVYVYTVRLGQVVQLAMRGKINAVYEINDDRGFTLTANAASTTLTDERLTVNSWVGFDPVTANAAAELAAGTMYALEANRNNGSWTITHANNAQADREFRVLIIG